MAPITPIAILVPANVFNDIAICAKRAQSHFNIRKILVVDLDVHQGDGTASIFADDNTVFTFSMHCDANFPFRKTTSDLDVGLPKGTTDDMYLETLHTHLESLVQVQPDLIFFQAGVDPLKGHLGRFNYRRKD